MQSLSDDCRNVAQQTVVDGVGATHALHRRTSKRFDDFDWCVEEAAGVANDAGLQLIVSTATFAALYDERTVQQRLCAAECVGAHEIATLGANARAIDHRCRNVVVEAVHEQLA